MKSAERSPLDVAPTLASDDEFRRARPLFEAARRQRSSFDGDAYRRVRERMSLGEGGRRSKSPQRARWVLVLGATILLASAAWAHLFSDPPPRLPAELLLERGPHVPARLILEPPSPSVEARGKRVARVESGPARLLDGAATESSEERLVENGDQPEDRVAPRAIAAKGATLPMDLESIRRARDRSPARIDYVPRAFRDR
ncbi:MAG: hypothetical protein HY791_16850 [Deltaproteobacteria bacterium]|nr:hypothetical protein [Deltaproteobacteria bacterium]